ncbi:MAG: tRNA (guanosine(37)-N1)-methyltransferase TrmD, partial [Armatimonadetes bacterium]|nr:tRNA (guanosine(37)-N1)-methyltransferase TrmD [Armatimonadota bacterium]
RSFREHEVPEVLLSGNHAEIARWRRQECLRRTLSRRPELLDAADLTEQDRRIVKELRAEARAHCGQA